MVVLIGLGHLPMVIFRCSLPVVLQLCRLQGSGACACTLVAQEGGDRNADGALLAVLWNWRDASIEDMEK